MNIDGYIERTHGRVDQLGSDRACPVSGSKNFYVFLEIRDVPVFCNVLYKTKEKALAAPTANLRLAYCPDSHHVFNAAFDASLISYSDQYENSLHYSPRFQEFADDLVHRLIETYDLRDKTIIDIGCGNGEFLDLICNMGLNQGLGFDPSYRSVTDEANDKRFRIIPDLYSGNYSAYEADLITCRHVLEHIEKPQEFVRDLWKTIGVREDTALYFEVPNIRHTLHNLAIWDLIYEHCSYYSCESLVRLFTDQGFVVTSVSETFGGQYLSLDANPGESDASVRNDLCYDQISLEADITAFRTRFQRKIGEWRAKFRRYGESERRIVVWGAGSKGVTILNLLGITNEIAYVVDVNPRKHGLYIPGTGHRVVPPSYLGESEPDVILIVNRIYEEEIRNTVREMNLSPEFAIA